MRDISDCYSKHRPVLHFSVPKGWMNDPNGLIYHDGWYHMYYQFYPDTKPLTHALGTRPFKDFLCWENLQ
jgi:fructan beta-fructosidase